MSGLMRFISNIRLAKQSHSKRDACEEPPTLKRQNARLQKRRTSGNNNVGAGLVLIHSNLSIREDVDFTRQNSFEPGQSLDEFEAVRSNSERKGLVGRNTARAASNALRIRALGSKSNLIEDCSKSTSHLPGPVSTYANNVSPTDSGIVIPDEFSTGNSGGKGKGRRRIHSYRRVSEEAREVMEAWLEEQHQIKTDQESEDRFQAELIEAHWKSQQEEQEEQDGIRAQELEEQLGKEEEEERLAAQRARLRECTVCGDLKDVDQTPDQPPSVGCEHFPHTCRECLQSWMASEFDTKGCEGIKCPECPQILNYNDVQRAASAKTFEAYDNLATRNALGALDEFSWCLKPNCGSGQLNAENSNFMDCVHCGYKQCLEHKVPWHSNETCAQYNYRTSGQKARDEERKTEAVIDLLSKKCPGRNCGWRIQKIDGCEHMTCKKCKHEFCWLCLASHREIKRIGNTAHAANCTFHSNNLQASWPFNAH